MIFLEELATEAGIAAAREYFGSPNLIRTRLNRVVNHLKGKSAKVIVFGPGGVGKSTLGKIVTEQAGVSELADYKSSVTSESFGLLGDLPVVFDVLPGQIDRRPDWSQLSMIEKSRNIGFIHTVSYGFHSLKETSYRENDLYTTGMTKRQFCEAHIRAGRQAEIETLREFCSVGHAINDDRKIWLITLITKQDLWWNKRVEVVKHYSDGEYSELVKEFSVMRGQGKFQHEFFGSCLLPLNFHVGNDLMAKTVAGYDSTVQSAHSRTFLAGVADLLESF